MSTNSIFNATVCIIGIAILLIHIVNILLKKERRVDENTLLNFFILTVIHFVTYLTFTFIKMNYTSNTFVISFYTTFYIFNNLEAFFLLIYTLSYIEMKKKYKNIIYIANLVLIGIFTFLDILNIFNGMFFTAINGEYVRAKTMIFAQGYQFIILAIVLLVTLFNKKLVIREKVAFGIYCLLPAVAIIVQNFLKGYAIAYFSIVISIEILFFFVNVQKNILLAKEQQKNKEAQIKIMMSQIQPHFIYNSLSSISTLIDINPSEAKKALDDFTEYLRLNLSSLTETSLIHFEDELRHIETYISLEKLRFNNRLNIKYDIKVTDFYVPPLSLQPLVENAIKHGILKKIEGGTLLFKTYEKDNAYVVEVIDDGVGFNINNIDFSKNQHIGINNIRQRLKTMCNATLEITSEVDKGTKAMVTFYK